MNERRQRRRRGCGRRWGDYITRRPSFSMINGWIANGDNIRLGTMFFDQIKSKTFIGGFNRGFMGVDFGCLRRSIDRSTLYSTLFIIRRFK